MARRRNFGVRDGLFSVWGGSQRRRNAALGVAMVERLEARALLTGGPTAPGQTVPTAHDDVIDTDEGNQVTIPVLANDSDPSGITFNSVTVGTQPTHGTILKIDPELGTITYNPAVQFAGTDSFTYTFRDKFGMLSNAATVTVIVNRPVANDDFSSTISGVPVVIAASDNDADPDGNDHLVRSSVKVVTSPAHGAASANGDGSFTYSPTPGFEGTDRFTYTIKDEAGATSNPGTVTIVVGAPPAQAGTVVNDDDIDTDEGNPVTVDVLGNDLSPVGFNPATVTVTLNPTHGSVSVDPATGAITYNPATQYFGTDSFTYTVKDKNGGIAGPGRVSVVVNRPTANDDFAETFGTTPVSLSVLENDTDPDGNGRIDRSSVKIVASPTNGVATLGVDGNVTYSANPGFSGTDHFTYTIKDEAGATSNTATATIVVDLGQVSGTVYSDYNLDGKQGVGETGLAGRVFFLDLNGDGKRGADEPATSSDADGRYTFKGLNAGAYSVLQDTVGDPTLVSLPPVGGTSTVTVTPDVPVVTGSGVGNLTISPISPVNLTPKPFPTNAANTATAFVQGVYRGVLGRDATDAVATRAAAKIAAHPSTTTRTAVAQTVWNSKEHRSAEVTKVYQTILGRNATAGEIGKLTRQYAAKGGEIGIATSLLSSKEFKAKAGSGNSAFVTALYQSALGRGPTAGELASLSAKLSNKRISAASAAKNVLTSQDGAGLLVDSLYISILQHPADPSTRQTLIDRLQSGRVSLESIGIKLLASSEYYARADASHA